MYEPLKVVDLFCGIGGLSFGFWANGFQVTGFDYDKKLKEVWEKNKLGTFIHADLNDTKLFKNCFIPCDVVIGGPPCQPWSALNRHKKRGERHPSYELFLKTADHIKNLNPKIFIIENVPPLASDPIYEAFLKEVGERFDVDKTLFCYANHGAPTRRTRLFTIGTNKEQIDLKAKEIIKQVNLIRLPPLKVGDVLKRYENVDFGVIPDHEYKDLSKRIKRIWWKYEKKRYGHKALNENEPAFSFGDINSCPILHHKAFKDERFFRTLTIREALTVMGFPEWFSFPNELSLSQRYKMIAQVVSPVFSTILAYVIKRILTRSGEVIYDWCI